MVSTKLQISHVAGRSLAITGLILFIVSQCCAAYVVAKFYPFMNALETADVVPPRDVLDSTMKNMPTLFIISSASFASGICGITMISLALLLYRYRALWFFWMVILTSVLMLPAFPVGTAIGAYFIFSCFAKRSEFFNVMKPDEKALEMIA